MKIRKFNESYTDVTTNGGWLTIGQISNYKISDIHDNGMKLYIVNIFSDIVEITNIYSINNRNSPNNTTHDLFPYAFIVDNTKRKTLEKLVKGVIDMSELYREEIKLRVDQIKGYIQ